MSNSESSAVRTTIVQGDPVLGNVAANFDDARTIVERARERGSDLVVFPELFLTGYHIGEDAEALAREASDALDDLRTSTDGITVVVGTPTVEGSAIYNSAVVLDDGAVAGTYRKTHLFGVEHDVFASGQRLHTVETTVGTLGVEICYDVEFPEVARRLALEGAEFLVTISANMRPCDPDQRLYHGARALENGFPHVLCNRVGEERGVDFFGNSGIVDYRGRRVLSLGADRVETSSATVRPKSDRTDAHEYLEDRRPDLYEE